MRIRSKHCISVRVNLFDLNNKMYRRYLHLLTCNDTPTLLLWVSTVIFQVNLG